MADDYTACGMKHKTNSLLSCTEPVGHGGPHHDANWVAGATWSRGMEVPPREAQLTTEQIVDKVLAILGDHVTMPTPTAKSVVMSFLAAEGIS